MFNKLENDEEEKVIEIQISQPVLTSRNQHWLWIGAGIFLLGILVLGNLNLYCSVLHLWKL